MKINKTLVKTRIADANRARVQKDLEAGLNGNKANKANAASATSVANDGQQAPPSPAADQAAAGTVRNPNRPKYNQVEARAKGLCFAFQTGTCTKSAEECIYTHEKASDDPNAKRPASPPAKPRAPRVTRTPEERAKIPCSFFAKGACRAGAKCEFNHSAPAEAATQG